MGEHKKKTRRPHKPPGTAPGTLHVDPRAPSPVVNVLAFDDKQVEEMRIDQLDLLRDLRSHWPLIWVDVNGLGEAAPIEGLGELFGLHNLALEDVVHVFQRSKVEPYEDHIFLVLHVPRFAADSTEFTTEQVSLFFGRDYVLTFQERASDCFDLVRERLRQGRRVRFQGADYLAYALLDAIVDHYFPLLEHIGDRIEGLEELVTEQPDRELLAEVRRLRRQLLHVRRTMWPLRDTLGGLLHEDVQLISERTRVYMRDCHDHVLRIIDLVESYREQLTGLMEAYMTSLNNRMNEVMKVLTIIATIFIPLSFVVGLYGMNFNSEASPLNMPELNWYLGYPMVLGLLAGIAGVMLVFFWRRGWLGAASAQRRARAKGEGPPRT